MKLLKKITAEDITTHFQNKVSEESARFLASATVVKTLRKGRVLFTEGSLDNNYYFVWKGLLKAYFEKNDTHIISNFIKPGAFISNMATPFSDGKSWRTIEAVTDVALRYITEETSVEMFRTYTDISQIFLDAMANELKAADLRLKCVTQQTAIDKCRFFEENYGEFLNHVPQYEIASFLDIAPETYSRIKKPGLSVVR
jgi:CRP/FNR family transcriptional regulator, anaerobic regulatory protein